MQEILLLEKKRLNKNFVIGSIILLCLSGLLLRLVNLDKTSLWVDEVIFAHTSQSWLESGEMQVPSGREYIRAPFYTMMTACMVRLFGEGEFSTRLTAVLFGMLSCLMGYFLSRKIFDDKAALLTLFLMVFSHFEIGWSRTARMYTMFQFTSLCIVYCLICLMETRRKYSFLARSVFEKMQLNPVWLSPFIFLFMISYLYVHALTAFLAVNFVIYLAVIAIIVFIVEQDKKKWLNKYFILGGLLLLAAILLIVLNLKSVQSIMDFFYYTPPWAKGDVSALNRMVLFEFLISPYRFPLAVFFFLGSIQLITRWQLNGILIFVFFVVQLFLLSFVFTHRKPVYIFNVYPFFLMIASFGFLNILYYELAFVSEKLKRLIISPQHTMPVINITQGMLTLAFFSIFILSPWLRVSLHIPFNEDGISNMAVTSAEWKETEKIIKRRANPDDLILASHPELALYYNIKADFTLNWTLLNQAKSFQLMRNNLYYDNYAGVYCIETLEQLKTLVAENKRGWILIETYAFNKSAYIPATIKEYIENHLNGPIMTQNKTIMIFYWNEDHSE